MQFLLYQYLYYSGHHFGYLHKMKKQKSLWRKNKYGQWYKLKPVNNKEIFIPCDNTTQTYNWQITNKSGKLKAKK